MVAKKLNVSIADFEQSSWADQESEVILHKNLPTVWSIPGR